ncbi:MAG: alpha/beta hydrolase, partial [Bradyrhizobium sp.]|nr:alpha/beta hydrolase [Bradyrhizobium sp.]
MLRWMVWFPLKLTQWVLGLVGAVALLLTAMVARPVSQPPELVSISNTARAVDRSTMPGLERFHGRDGTELAYRHYPARGQATGQ